MGLSEDFKVAQEDVNKLSKRPSNSELLDLYALYKQSEVGDVSGSKPSMFDLKGKAKYDAWKSKKGIDKDSAMQTYINLVNKLKQNYN